MIILNYPGFINKPYNLLKRERRAKIEWSAVTQINLQLYVCCPFRRISDDVLITNKRLILDFLLLLPSYYCNTSTLSWLWPPLFFSLQSSPRFTAAQVFSIDKCGGIFLHFVFPSTLRLSHGPSSSEISFQDSFCFFCCRTSLVYAQPAYTLPRQCLYTV
jgi:hypothetical protein